MFLQASFYSPTSYQQIHRGSDTWGDALLENQPVLMGNKHDKSNTVQEESHLPVTSMNWSRRQKIVATGALSERGWHRWVQDRIIHPRPSLSLSLSPSPSLYMFSLFPLYSVRQFFSLFSFSSVALRRLHFPWSPPHLDLFLYDILWKDVLVFLIATA